MDGPTPLPPEYLLGVGSALLIGILIGAFAGIFGLLLLPLLAVLITVLYGAALGAEWMGRIGREGEDR
jgi:hypothetical protein